MIERPCKKQTFFLQKPVDRQKLGKLFRTVRGGFLESRRRHIRVPLQTAVSLQQKSRTINAVSWNLSQGGIQVEADGLRVSETIRLSLRLPASDVLIEAVGVVVWVEEKRQGIQFTNVSAKNEQAIREFIAEVEKQDQ
jgi:c-di-GMP-binding flagellar brake protein YcgR